MRQHGIRAIMAQPRRVRTTDSRHDFLIAPNLRNRNFTAAAPNRIWLADITYAADVAGYSRLMHNNEEATHAELTALLTDAVYPAITEHCQLCSIISRWSKRWRPEIPLEGAGAWDSFGYRKQSPVSRNRDYVLNISGFLATNSSHSSRIIL